MNFQPIHHAILQLMERRIVTTTRECPARLVPVGDEITIPAGSFITLTQALGGAFTVVIEGNMARIAGSDADDDAILCDAGEACGAYPTLDSPEFIAINDDLAGLDFESNFRINLTTNNQADTQMDCTELPVLLRAIKLQDDATP